MQEASEDGSDDFRASTSEERSSPERRAAKRKRAAKQGTTAKAKKPRVRKSERGFVGLYEVSSLSVSKRAASVRSCLSCMR